MSLLRGGMGIPTATVECVRYPGNSYDRQYAKLRRPFGAWHDDVLPEERFRLALGDKIVQHHLERLRAAGAGRLNAPLLRGKF